MNLEKQTVAFETQIGLIMLGDIERYLTEQIFDLIVRQFNIFKFDNISLKFNVHEID